MIKNFVAALCLVAVFVVMGAQSVHAQGFLSNLFGGNSGTGGGSSTQQSTGGFGGGGGSGGGCGNTKTHFVACTGSTGVGAIGDVIRTTLIVMTILIGAIATGAIAYAGILYATSRDDREKVQQAIKIIRNVVIGLIMYALTIALINWLVPGSVIGGGDATTQGPCIDPETGAVIGSVETGNPTASPTTSPTASPTASPTTSPSPTVSPTTSGSPSPTTTPSGTENLPYCVTEESTESPTVSPTTSGSPSPTTTPQSGFFQ